MSFSKIAILISIAMALLGVIGDSFIKASGNTQKFIDVRWFTVGLLIYASTAFGWFFAMKYLKLPTLGVFYTISTVLFLTLVSVFYFKEPLTYYELLGILLAFASIGLLWSFA